ncbi:MAG: hypothetical protein HQL93_02010 [Magnetococcales bacterium]|nr:hypothetical protein [Magnetococcales bacterium]
MTVTIAIRDIVFEGEQVQTKNLSNDFEQAYIVWKYLNSQISIGKLSELLNFNIEEAKQFLHGIGIPTSRSLGSDLDSVMKENMTKVAVNLGLDL